MKNNTSVVLDIFKIILAAVILTIVVRIFIFQSFYIPSSSMEPTLMPDDRIIASKLPYFFYSVQKGDIVVFKLPSAPAKAYIKRVVALENELVQIRDNTLYVNNKKVEEEYLPPNMEVPPFGPVKIPVGSVFVMGDNRKDSFDSRFWGPLNEKLIVSKALFKFWPIPRLGLI